MEASCRAGFASLSPVPRGYSILILGVSSLASRGARGVTTKTRGNPGLHHLRTLLHRGFSAKGQRWTWRSVRTPIEDAEQRTRASRMEEIWEGSVMTWRFGQRIVEGVCDARSDDTAGFGGSFECSRPQFQVSREDDTSMLSPRALEQDDMV